VAQWRELLDRLGRLERLEGDHVENVLKYASQAIPVETLDMLLARISALREERSADYLPMPYWHQGSPLIGVSSHPAASELFARVLDAVQGAGDRERFWAVELFGLLAQGADALAGEALLTWWSGDGAKVKLLASLLREAPASLVLTQPRLVEQLLEQGMEIGSEMSAKIQAAMRAGVFKSAVEGPVGPEFPGLAAQLDAIADSLPEGECRRFYESAARRAQELSAP
jgi:hypothetical protein